MVNNMPNQECNYRVGCFSESPLAQQPTEIELTNCRFPYVISSYWHKNN